MSVSVTGAQTVGGAVQNIGITEEAINLGEVTPGGYCYFENLDSTNFISLRRATGEADFVKMKPGEFALFRMDPDASAPFAIADTGPCDMLVVMLED